MKTILTTTFIQLLRTKKNAKKITKKKFLPWFRCEFRLRREKKQIKNRRETLINFKKMEKWEKKRRREEDIPNTRGGE